MFDDPEGNVSVLAPVVQRVPPHRIAVLRPEGPLPLTGFEGWILARWREGAPVLIKTGATPHYTRVGAVNSLIKSINAWAEDQRAEEGRKQ